MIAISIGHIVNRDALYLTDGDLYKTNPAMGNLLMTGASYNRCYTYIHNTGHTENNTTNYFLSMMVLPSYSLPHVLTRLTLTSRKFRNGKTELQNIENQNMIMCLSRLIWMSF